MDDKKPCRNERRRETEEGEGREKWIWEVGEEDRR
jgi:hypothetical protein